MTGAAIVERVMDEARRGGMEDWTLTPRFTRLLDIIAARIDALVDEREDAARKGERERCAGIARAAAARADTHAEANRALPVEHFADARTRHELTATFAHIAQECDDIAAAILGVDLPQDSGRSGVELGTVELGGQERTELASGAAVLTPDQPAALLTDATPDGAGQET